MDNWFWQRYLGNPVGKKVFSISDARTTSYLWKKNALSSDHAQKLSLNRSWLKWLKLQRKIKEIYLWHWLRQKICYTRHKMQESQTDSMHFIKIKNLGFLKSQWRKQEAKATRPDFPQHISQKFYHQNI